jgi:tetratricopeptide (TPR) repeat protein
VRKLVEAALLVLSISLACADAPRDGLVRANAALQSGEADQALQLLSGLPSSADAHNLRCRVYFALERWDQAAAECDQAVRLDSGNSMNHLWLGRALGEKADSSSFMTAFSLAKRARAEFEEAVNLDPHNGEAMSDLGEFYASAPGVVGGGNDKAQALVPKLEKVDPARAHVLLARIAESRKDYGTAERELKQAVATSEHPAIQWITLAAFYKKHERWDEMETAVATGYKQAQHDRGAGIALFNGASVLIGGKRNLALAAKMLEEYLADYPRTEEGPAFEAHTRLAQVKAQLGDKNGAIEQRAEALKLAHDYKPALGLTF